jgi:hypothetical protein
MLIYCLTNTTIVLRGETSLQTLGTSAKVTEDGLFEKCEVELVTSEMFENPYIIIPPFALGVEATSSIQHLDEPTLGFWAEEVASLFSGIVDV